MQALRLIRPLHAVQLAVAMTIASFCLVDPALGQDTGIGGEWILDVESSDDVARAIENGTRAVARVRRPGAEAGLGAASEAASQVAIALVRHVERDATNVEIVISDQRITMLTTDGTVVSYGLEDEKTGAIVGGQVVVQTSAEWDGAELTLKAGGPGNARIEERYELDEDTAELRVEIRVIASSAGLNARIRRTYHRAPEATRLRRIAKAVDAAREKA